MSADFAVKSQPRARTDLKIPVHVGVIMDGNGRWARSRGKVRTEGHVAGVKALRRLVEVARARARLESALDADAPLRAIG